ncbi:MAG: PadR family transcriptional regulator [Actinobacteria bacterium 13_2_20CM_2_71_6]|nr:MAG: PadR family transcriptional regulator [Actinobacteria bacterium 13_2_20CM_2_71_6]
MSLRYALLGLLAHRSASGYDLMGTFRSSLAHVWPATQSQVYGELTRLTNAGLLTVGEQGPRGRREYAITEAGRAELDGWLTDETARTPQRSTLLLHAFFLGLAEPARARRYLSRQAELADGRMARLRELEGSVDWDGGPLSTHGRLALEYGLRLAAMQRDWATWAATQIAAAPAEA